MQATESVRLMLERSHNSARKVSEQIGRSANWISATLRVVNDVKAGTLSQIADACGYDLLLEKRDTKERIIIDAPTK